MIFLLLYFTLLQGSEFSIKLASYSNKERLLQQIDSLGEGIGEGVVIIKAGDIYKAYSAPLSTKEEALAVLPLYRQLFQDAYITSKPIEVTHASKTSQIKHTTQHIKAPHQTTKKPTPNQDFETYQKDIQPTEKKPVMSQPNISQPYASKEHSHTEEHNSTTQTLKITKQEGLLIPDTQQRYRKSLQTILQGRTFFICPDTITSNSQKLLMEAKFDGQSVTYKTIMGEIPSIKIAYAIQKERLYFLRNGRANPKHFTQVEREYFEYYVVSKWVGKKVINRMRYYKIQEAAQSYLDSLDF